MDVMKWLMNFVSCTVITRMIHDFISYCTPSGVGLTSRRACVTEHGGDTCLLAGVGSSVVFT